MATEIHGRITASEVERGPWERGCVIPEMTSKANSSHSTLFLGREHENVQNYKL